MGPACSQPLLSALCAAPGSLHRAEGLNSSSAFQLASNPFTHKISAAGCSSLCVCSSHESRLPKHLSVRLSLKPIREPMATPLCKEHVIANLFFFLLLLLSPFLPFNMQQADTRHHPQLCTDVSFFHLAKLGVQKL